MTRLAELQNDFALRQAVLAVRGASSTLSGREVTEAEAEFLVGIALATFANAGGLNEPSIGHLARFSERLGPNATVDSLTKH
jgi:hypothetical protein